MERIYKKFKKTVSQNPQTIALKFKNMEGIYKDTTYSELFSKIENFAIWLLEQGVEARSRIAIISKNRPEWIITDFAAQAIGAVLVPIYDTLTSDQISYIIKDSGSAVIIVENNEQYEKIKPFQNLFKAVITIEGVKDSKIPLISELSTLNPSLKNRHSDLLKNREDSVAIESLQSLIYTSGTTGDPKGVMLTHKNLAANLNSILILGTSFLKKGDTSLCFLPFSHIYARTGEYYCFLTMGNTLAFAESMEKIVDNLQEVRPTILYSVPRLYEKVFTKINSTIEGGSPIKKLLFKKALAAGERYYIGREKSFALSLQIFLFSKIVFGKIKERLGGNIRFMISGGSALAPEIAKFFICAGIPILEGYGLTETSPVLTFNDPENFKIGYVGKTVEGVEIRLAEDGEILAKGDNIMKGYWNKPEETRAVLSEDGWFATGDLGEIDEDGFLKIIDRKKDIFVLSSGKNVSPQNVEKLLILNPYVSQAILIGDNRNYVSALIVPNSEKIREFATKNNIKYSALAELVKNERLKEHFNSEIEKINTNLARYEQIKKYHLLDKDFTINEGEMTPSMKIRRKVVYKKYETLINSMYN